MFIELKMNQMETFKLISKKFNSVTLKLTRAVAIKSLKTYLQIFTFIKLYQQSQNSDLRPLTFLSI